MHPVIAALLSPLGKLLKALKKVRFKVVRHKKVFAEKDYSTEVQCGC